MFVRNLRVVEKNAIIHDIISSSSLSYRLKLKRVICIKPSIKNNEFFVVDKRELKNYIFIILKCYKKYSRNQRKCF